MTINLFSKKIKDIKIELTNLKTAHKRGLGSLQIYTYDINIDPTGHEYGFWELSFTADFDRTFAAYPFAYLEPQAQGNFVSSLEMESFGYFNDGYRIVFNAIWFYDSAAYNARIISSAPITNISYSWGNS